MNILDFVLERLSETSTYRGLLIFIGTTAWGANLSPEMTHAIIAILASVFAAIEVCRKEPKKEK